MATHPIQGQDPENPTNTKRTMPSGPGLPAFWSNDMDRALAYLEVHQYEYEKMVPELKTWFPQLTNIVIAGASLDKRVQMLDQMDNDYFMDAAFEHAKWLKSQGVPVDEYDESKYPVVEPEMKSDMEIFGDGTPMKGALAIGGSVDDDDLAPKFGKMKVNDKKAKDKQVKKEEKLHKKAKEEGAERKSSFFGIKMTPKNVNSALKGYKLGELGEGGSGVRNDTKESIMFPADQVQENAPTSGSSKQAENPSNTHHFDDDTIKSSSSTRQQPLTDASNSRPSPYGHHHLGEPRAGMEKASERRRARAEGH